jgi:thiol-disulfide isomerase/thioredoxin
MKYLLLVLIGSLMVCCNTGEVDKTTYYRDTKTGVICSGLDYQDIKAQKEEEAKAAFLLVEEVMGDSIIVKDSIIKDYTFIYRLDKEKLATKQESSRVNLVGQNFKPFNLTTINNETIRTTMSNGKPTLVNIWFIACKPCVEEIPDLNNIVGKYADKMNFISLTFDTKEKVDAFIAETPFNFTPITDARQLIDRLGVVAYPQSLLIDKDGVITHVKGNQPQELRQIIDELYS